MPIYNYTCKSCSHEFSELHKMDDRNIPVEQPCPECGIEEVRITIGAPKLVSGVGSNLKKAGNDWKDLVGRIKSSSGSGNTIND